MPAIATSLSLLALVCAAAHAEFTAVRHVSAAPRALEPAVIPPAQFVVPFSAKTPRRTSKTSLMTALRGHVASKNFTVVLAGSDFDKEYLTDITVGGQTFPVIVDTGSSDTWLVKKGFKCFDLDGDLQPTKSCGFGSFGFNTTASKTFREFPKVSFNISYGDGEFLSGPVGFDTVSVGGLQVTQQELGTPDLAAWTGDAVNSGLLGLAYPDLTSVYNTTDPTKASNANHIPYDPFFATAIKQGKVTNPYFSIALNRPSSSVNPTSDPSLGFLAFGGMPPVAVSKTAVTVPVQGYSATTDAPTTKNAVYWYYTVDVAAFVFPNSTSLSTANHNTILDSGTTLNYLPTDVAKKYNARFEPKATLEQGLYLVACNATAPPFSVNIGGQLFSIDPRDQILATEEEDVCISGTQDGGAATPENVFILGDVFLHNVVATFDIEANHLTVTQRMKY